MRGWPSLYTAQVSLRPPEQAHRSRATSALPFSRRSQLTEMGPCMKQRPLSAAVAATTSVTSLANCSMRWGSNASLNSTRARPLPNLHSKTAHGLDADSGHQFQYVGFRR